MVGFRKKSQDSASFSRSSGTRADGRAGAASSGAAQRSRTEPTARSGKERRGPVAGRRGYTASEQMDSRCLTLAESASGVLGRSLDQALGRLPDGPGAPASGGSAGPASPAAGNWLDAVGVPGSTRGRGASTGSVRSTQVGAGQVGAGQVDTVADIASDIEF